MVNHPAHILEEEEEGGFSLSSFIPFCQLGEDMAVMGRLMLSLIRLLSLSTHFSGANMQIPEAG